MRTNYRYRLLFFFCPPGVCFDMHYEKITTLLKISIVSLTSLLMVRTYWWAIYSWNIIKQHEWFTCLRFKQFVWLQVRNFVSCVFIITKTGSDIAFHNSLILRYIFGSHIISVCKMLWWESKNCHTVCQTSEVSVT